VNRLVARVAGAICWVASCAPTTDTGALQQGDATPVPRATATLGQSLAFAVQRAEEHAYEQQFDPRAPPNARALLGPNPSRIVALAGDLFAVTLARTGEVALFDRELSELDRAFALPGATAIALDEHGTLWVGATSRRELVALRVRSGRFERVPALDRAGFASIGVRELTSRGDCLYAVDEHASELAWSCGGSVSRRSLSARPVAVASSEHFLLVTSALGHTLSVFPLPLGGAPAAEPITITNDGPFFGAAIHERADGSLVVASGGIENHPLDRRRGSFGYIDSFVYVDAVEHGAARRLAAVDVGELGVITPKALALREIAGTLRVDVTSYGASAAAIIEIPPGSSPTSRLRAAAPGLSALVVASDGVLVATSPLLDALVRVGADVRVAPVVDGLRPEVDPRLPERETMRLGEALFFTNAMGPFQRSEGELSRFTCESCHFEGGIDGRVHNTGRGDVVATTKPLFGLGNNGPHFTRALDADLTQMVFAEFRVAAANSGHSEWFALDEAGLDWLSMSEATATRKSALDLRRALVLYLASLPHEQNPRTLGRTALTPLERRGASLFAGHCEGCHEARLASNDPSSRAPFDEWESLVLAPAAPIVWARDGYEKTGVLPYVHESGARPSSLRRIAAKMPYFTNGAAKTLGEVVARASITEDDVFLHDGATVEGGAPLFDDGELRALVAFLDLL
jgi:hypothetical protein